MESTTQTILLMLAMAVLFSFLAVRAWKRGAVGIHLSPNFSITRAEYPTLYWVLVLIYSGITAATLWIAITLVF